MSIQNLIQAEDRAAGRVIPKARYWSAYWLIAVAHIWGVFVALRDLPWWVSAIGIMVIFYAFTVLLDKYKQRSIK